MRAPCQSDATGEAPPSNYISGMMRNPMRRIGQHIVVLSLDARLNYRSSDCGFMGAANEWFLSTKQPGQGLRQPD